MVSVVARPSSIRTDRAETDDGSVGGYIRNRVCKEGQVDGAAPGLTR